jgi:hypothetical protein
MFLYADEHTKYIFILDNDESIDSNNKQSTVKIFQLDEALTFVDEWNSRSFGTTEIYPINDLDIFGNEVFVTLGNYGIGYGQLHAGQVVSYDTIQLPKLPEINAILLKNSFFKQIEVVEYDKKRSEISLFISSTNSLSMVASFAIHDLNLSFREITETYYRYGTQRLLNWHAITYTHVYLSYYSESKEKLTIVTYSRKINKKN